MVLSNQGKFLFNSWEICNICIFTVFSCREKFHRLASNFPERSRVSLGSRDSMQIYKKRLEAEVKFLRKEEQAKGALMTELMQVHKF